MRRWRSSKATRSACSCRHGTHQVAKKFTSTQRPALVGEVERRRRRGSCPTSAGRRLADAAGCRPAGWRPARAWPARRRAGRRRRPTTTTATPPASAAAATRRRRPSSAVGRRRRPRPTSRSRARARRGLAVVRGRRRGDRRRRRVERVARRRPGKAARNVPTTIRPPPIHSHTTSGWTMTRSADDAGVGRCRAAARGRRPR